MEGGKEWGREGVWKGGSVEGGKEWGREGVGKASRSGEGKEAPPLSPKTTPSFRIWNTTESTMGALPSTLITLAASSASCSSERRA